MESSEIPAQPAAGVPAAAPLPTVNTGAELPQLSALPLPSLPPPAVPAIAPTAAVPGLGMGGLAGGLPPLLQLPLPIMNDPAMLSQATGFPLKTLQENPGMMVAAQQLFAQRLLQQQFLSNAQLMRPPGMLPGNVQPQNLQQMQQMQAAAFALHQQQQQQYIQQNAQSKASGGKGKGSKSTGAKQSKPAPAPAPTLPLVKEDPGGKVIWAKVVNYPWWPAKILDPARDRSFPHDAEPPRPTAIPVRFFGTHEFGWMGSKRALHDWEEGLPQFSKESEQESFKAAIAEAEEYIKSGTLPDKFYMLPESESAKRPGKVRKRGSTATGVRKVAGAAAAAAAGDFVTTPGGTMRPRSGRVGGAFGSPQERAALVQSRKRQRLLELGLLPPTDSPYGGGVAAPNPALLEMAGAWNKEFPEVMAAAKEAVLKKFGVPSAPAAIQTEQEATAAPEDAGNI